VSKKTEYTLAFAFDEGGRNVALILKDHPDWQKGRANGIGGKVEPGETPFETNRREFLEEAGVDLVCMENFATLACDSHNSLLHCYTAALTRDEFARIRPMTDARILFMPLTHLLSDPRPLSNVPWLVVMAHRFLFSKSADGPVCAHGIHEL